MARTRVTIDQRAIDAYFRTDPMAQGALARIAGDYKAVAEEASPVGHSTGKFIQRGGRTIFIGGRPYRHGLFRKAFSVRRFRGGYRVYNADRFAFLVEFGSAKNAAFAPMRRALMAMIGGRAVVQPHRETGEHTIR